MSSTNGSRVGLLGPLLPFRGGIAQHTTMLLRALHERAECRALSFSRQYPAWLFPGASDRDPAYAGYAEPGADYVVDSLDPRTWRRAVLKLSEFAPDLVVLPWWTIYWAPSYWVILRGLRRRRIPVVLFCHNVVEHETAAWKKLASTRILCQADRFVVHTMVDADNLRAVLPRAEVAVHPHPIYDQFPQPRGTLERRAPLELLFFGFVRRYKGLDVLIEALGRANRRDFRLSIVGEFWEGEEETRRMVRAYGLEDKVEIVSRYVSDEETAEYFHRADVVVLPYRSATGSGVVPIAFHYRRPVVASSVGGLPDIVRPGNNGYLVPPEDPAALASVIETIDHPSLSSLRSGLIATVQQLTWASLADTVLTGVSFGRPPHLSMGLENASIAEL